MQAQRQGISLLLRALDVALPTASDKSLLFLSLPPQLPSPYSIVCDAGPARLMRCPSPIACASADRFAE
ncbi:protein of unknown function [Methylorubrum extorquens]|uniref:Uncharacterized protein n=1 Tax=Methylorubrum extorquens TaxID=408 RepID=A0A2N9AK29_METEX|nr:protein of unknown function [Methylorubrum extorquens]